MTERPILFSAPSQAHGADGFWSRVDRSGGDSACWPWTGALNPKGYGRRRWGPGTNWWIATDSFRTLWTDINGKRPGCAWSDNPWVWRVEFARLEAA